jgi:hypothetical protein
VKKAQKKREERIASLKTNLQNMEMTPMAFLRAISFIQEPIERADQDEDNEDPINIDPPNITPNPCPVCLTLEKDRVLNCGHTLCQNCIEVIQAANNPACPVCRTIISRVQPFYY